MPPKKAFAVPYASPEQKERFAQFSKKNELKSFLSASERTVEEHDRLLAQMSSTQLLHIDLSEVGVGMRLVLVNQQAFDVTFPDVDQGNKVTFRNGAVHEYHAVPIPHGHSTIGEYRAGCGLQGCQSAEYTSASWCSNRTVGALALSSSGHEGTR